MKPENKKTISKTFVSKFAELSGDFNPVHIDLLAARRTIFGKTIVHGMALVLVALDRYLSDPTDLLYMKAIFHKAVFVEETVWIYEFDKSETGQILIIRDSMGNKTTTVKLRVKDNKKRKQTSAQKIFIKEPCLEFQPNSFKKKGFDTIDFNKKFARDLFPSLSINLPNDTVGFLLALTRIVGMKVPGLHSLFSGFVFENRCENVDSANNQIEWVIKDFHKMHQMLLLEIQSHNFISTVESFQRPKPVKQARVDELSHLKNDSLQGKSILVVGGSRGIGEVCTKVAAIMGASHITFTFNTGTEEARKIIGELSSLGGTYTSAQYDITADCSSLAMDLRPDGIIFCATPAIHPNTKEFSVQNFNQFMDFYVHGILRLAAAFSYGKPLTIVMPSTVFINKSDHVFTEYAAAKAAAEVVGKSLSSRYPNISFHSPRLGRVLTDQSNSFLSTDYDNIILAASMLVESLNLEV